MQAIIALFKLLECLKEVKKEFAEQNNRIAQIEFQNERQDEELKSVQRDTTDDRIEINKIKNKVAKYFL